VRVHHFQRGTCARAPPPFDSGHCKQEYLHPLAGTKISESVLDA
jgi:hypothetical protein